MMGQEFSGILRERISIERQTVGRDALGSAEPQYVTVGVFRAAAEALYGGTPSEAESRSAMPRWRFILRETRAIKPGENNSAGGRKEMMEKLQKRGEVLAEQRLADAKSEIKSVLAEELPDDVQIVETDQEIQMQAPRLGARLIGNSSLRDIAFLMRAAR